MPWVPIVCEHHVRTAASEPLYLPVPCLSMSSMSVQIDDRTVERNTDNLVAG